MNVGFHTRGWSFVNQLTGYAATPPTRQAIALASTQVLPTFMGTQCPPLPTLYSRAGASSGWGNSPAHVKIRQSK